MKNFETMALDFTIVMEKRSEVRRSRSEKCPKPIAQYRATKRSQCRAEYRATERSQCRAEYRATERSQGRAEYRTTKRSQVHECRLGKVAPASCRCLPPAGSRCHKRGLPPKPLSRKNRATERSQCRAEYRATKRSQCHAKTAQPNEANASREPCHQTTENPGSNFVNVPTVGTR